MIAFAHDPGQSNLRLDSRLRLAMHLNETLPRHFKKIIMIRTLILITPLLLPAAAPFGGYRMSGMARELGEEGLRAYTETKTVAVTVAM